MRSAILGEFTSGRAASIPARRIANVDKARSFWAGEKSWGAIKQNEGKSGGT